MALPRVPERRLSGSDRTRNRIFAGDETLSTNHTEELCPSRGVAAHHSSGVQVHASNVALSLSQRNTGKRSTLAVVCVDRGGSISSEINDPHALKSSTGIAVWRLQDDRRRHPYHAIRRRNSRRLDLPCAHGGSRGHGSCRGGFRPRQSTTERSWHGTQPRLECCLRNGHARRAPRKSQLLGGPSHRKRAQLPDTITVFSARTQRGHGQGTWRSGIMPPPALRGRSVPPPERCNRWSRDVGAGSCGGSAAQWC